MTGATPVRADQFVKRVNDWLIMKTASQSEDDLQYCYVVGMPYRTKAYHGDKIRSPHFMVIYLAPDEYTIKVNVDYDIDVHHGVIVSINAVPRMLEKAFDSGVVYTYSSVQDIAMINDLMLAQDYFTVRSADKDNNQALDYYSLKGFGKAVRIMTKACR